VDVTRGDGRRKVFPDIAQVDTEVIQHWTKRAAETPHPILKARYSDLLWDLTKAATGERPPIEVVRQAIDSYIESGQRFPSTDTAEARLDRAIELSLSVGDDARSSSSLSTMFSLLDGSDQASIRAMWLFDLQFRRKGIKLSVEQEAKLIDVLEKRLQLICGSENPFGPAALEPAARLARCYDRLGRTEDKKRVICAYGDAIANIAGKAHGLVALHWLQEAYGVFLHFGLKEEAEALQIAAKAKAEESASQMVSHRISVEIPNEEMAQFLEAITAGGLQDTLNRIAVSFCPNVEEVRTQLSEMKEQHKLLSMIPHTMLSGEQIIGRAGSIEDDPDGRLFFQIRDNMKFESVWLQAAFSRTREKHDFSPTSLLPHLFESPLFDPARTGLLEQGIGAYIVSDHVKAIHVLLPQIEHCLRRLLGMLGKPTNKHRRSDLGIMVEKSLNDVLESESRVRQCLGEDTTIYLQVLLCDPRGFNLRNAVAHGLMDHGQFHSFFSDRLIHVLLLLSLLRANPKPPKEGG
jgi:lysyl-tRNA synthetase class 1